MIILGGRAVIIPWRHGKRIAIIECKKNALEQTVMELFPNKSKDDLSLAIGAGMRAIERGHSFMDAMEAVEGVFNILEDRDNVAARNVLINQRNLDRRAFYEFKRAVIYGE